MPSSRSLDPSPAAGWFARLRMQWRRSRRQVLRFLAVGVLNTAFSFSIYSAFLYAGLHFTLANFISLVLGVVFSFRTQGALVFNNRDWRLFRRFVLVWFCIWIIYSVSIAAFAWAGLNDYLAGAVSLPGVVIASYLLQKQFVFRPVRSAV